MLSEYFLLPSLTNPKGIQRWSDLWDSVNNAWLPLQDVSMRHDPLYDKFAFLQSVFSKLELNLA